MEDLVLLKKSKELEEFAKKLGFSKISFLGTDFVLIKNNSKKDALRQIQEAKRKKIRTVYKAESEEMLRFVLEKTEVDVVYGMEEIHPKDSLHFVRGGLDQVLCKIAADKGKTIAFSFADLLNSSQRAKELGRMMFNVKLCKKYKVKMLLASFAASETEMCSAKDLQAFGRVIGL